MAPESVSAAAENTNPEDVLGQFYVAFGQGAGHVRVRREAIAALRDRYFIPIRTAPVRWEAVANNVLSLVAQVGRLAALLATQNGRTAISADDFTAARLCIEGRVREQELKAGPFCPVELNDQRPVQPTDNAALDNVDAGVAAPTAILH